MYGILDLLLTGWRKHMNYRKELKIRARQSLKRHYALWVVLCLLMLVLSGNHLFTYSVDLVENSVGSSKEQESTFVQVIRDIISGNRENGRVLAEKNIQEIRQSKENEEAVLGRREGVLSDIVNRIHQELFWFPLQPESVLLSGRTAWHWFFSLFVACW